MNPVYELRGVRGLPTTYLILIARTDQDLLVPGFGPRTDHLLVCERIPYLILTEKLQRL